MTPPVSNPQPVPSTDAPTVGEHLDAVAKTVRAQHAEALNTLRTDGLDPLQDTLAQVAEAHDEAWASLNEEEEPSRHVLWTTIRRYRQLTMDSVWRPLRATIDDLALGTVLADCRTRLTDAGETVADEVPETVERPEPTDLYSPLDADSWGWAVLKALGRGWRVMDERVRGTEARTQTVPLSALVTRYAATTLATARAEALATAEQRLVQWGARLERVSTAWTHRLLEIERLLDRPEFHAPTEDVSLPEPSEDPTAGVMDADVSALYAAVQEQAAALHECLDDGRVLPLDDVAETLEQGVGTTVEQIRDAADRAGSMLAERVSETGGRQAARDETKQWDRWFDEATQRLAFHEALADLHDDLIDRHASLVADVVAAGVAPVREVKRETVERLKALREEVDVLLETPEAGAELDLVQAFDHQAETGTDVLEQNLLAPLRELTPRRATDTAVETHRSAVRALVDEQRAGFVVHPLVEEGTTPVTPNDDTYTLQWRNGSEEVFDEVLFDGWRTALRPLYEASDRALKGATEVRAVVHFHLGAALQELQDLREARQQGRGDDTYIEDARELALDGLGRAVELLSADEAELDRAAGRVLHETWTATTSVWTELHDRVRVAGQARAHVLRLRGTLVRGARWLALETGRQVRAATTQVQRTAHRIQRQARRLVRLGQEAVGTEAVDEEALRQTVETLSTVDDVLADLPLVYRRLFSFRPIQDPALLVARDTDRAAVERHRDRWQRGLTDALMLTGPAGSGRTSLLNVLRKTTFRTARRHDIELTERITSESAFARQVGETFDLSLDPDQDVTLDAVAEHMTAEPVPDRLHVCTIEHFEHVVQRTVGGMKLAARVLDFLSETDTHVLWVVTTTDATWQLLEASEPAAARLVARHALDPLDRAELEELILRRHRRSGLQLAFEVPEESARPILARRLRALDHEEQRQALLRAEFFDRLYEASGQNVMLALFYWFRAVTLDGDSATLRVRPLESIAFGALDTLPLSHAFALKALLEHGTLTVTELAAVLGVSDTTSRSLLETLGNALVIAPAARGEGPGTFQFTSADYDTRYRVRPLLIHPVTRFLRSRNIVH